MLWTGPSIRAISVISHRPGRAWTINRPSGPSLAGRGLFMRMGMEFAGSTPSSLISLGWPEMLIFKWFSICMGMVSPNNREIRTSSRSF
jgi:hypothetical protein